MSNSDLCKKILLKSRYQKQRLHNKKIFLLMQRCNNLHPNLLKNKIKLHQKQNLPHAVKSVNCATYYLLNNQNTKTKDLVICSAGQGSLLTTKIFLFLVFLLT